VSGKKRRARTVSRDENIMKGLFCLVVGALFAVALYPSLAALDMNQLGWVALITAIVLPVCLWSKSGPWQKVFFVCLLAGIIISAGLLKG
jgi:hypothetical protein